MTPDVDELERRFRELEHHHWVLFELTRKLAMAVQMITEAGVDTAKVVDILRKLELDRYG